MPDQPLTMAALLDAMPRSNPTSHAAAAERAGGVTRSSEFQRILNLPRRTEPQDLARLLSAMTKTPHGELTLRLRQAWALTELYDFSGCFNMQPVGDGKTLPSLLAPYVMRWRNIQRYLIIVPAKLRKKTLNEIEHYAQHFHLPHDLADNIISYSMLSSAARARELWERGPQLIICDEIHALKNKKSARWKRFRAYFDDNPNTILMALSGTMTNRSLKDYGHILALTHGKDDMPVPYSHQRLEEWADAIDSDVPDDRRVAPGALLELCAPGENARQGFRRRLIETPGVIASPFASPFGDEAEPGIEIHEANPDIPEKIAEAFENLRNNWTTPGGEEISDGMSLWRHASSLAAGFYQRWVWPCEEHDNCPDTWCASRKPDMEWLEARRAWKKFVRETLRYNRRQLYSELQVWRECEAGGYDSEEFRAWMNIKEKHGTNGPPRESVWVSDFLIEHAERYMRRKARGANWLVWVRNPSVGQRASELLDIPYFGAGDEGILTHQGSCIVSLRAHGDGKNLQRFTHNLFLAIPLGGARWQQVMGRTHRPGQEADVVEYHVYLHCAELLRGFLQAQNDANYIQDTGGGPQKLKAATICRVYTDDDILRFETSGDPLWANITKSLGSGFDNFSGGEEL